MRYGLPETGYTIIEVLIFLAVTGVLFASGVLMVQGQMAKAQFSTSVNDLDSDLRSIINDVSTGFYPGVTNFTCSVASGRPAFASGTGAQGENTDCTFIGKVVQFGIGNSQCTGVSATNECTNYNVYTVVGRRDVSGNPPTSLQAAQPTVLETPTLRTITARKALNSGLHVTRVFGRSGSVVNYGSVGFFMGQGLPTGGASGVKNADMVAIPSSSIGQGDNPATPGAISTINNLNTASAASVATATNPSGGITVCLRGGNNKKAAVTIGAASRQFSTQVILDQVPGECP